MSLRDHGRDSREWRPPRYDMARSNFVTTTLCLPCSDGDHHVCYGERCECYCKGEQV